MTGGKYSIEGGGHSATLSIINVTMVDDVFKSGLHGTTKINLTLSTVGAYRAVNTLRLGYKNRLYREIIAVCSEIHTKHINTL